MGCTSTFQFSILFSLLLVSFLGVEGKLPQSCKTYECPTYDVIEEGQGYEIRRYNSPHWVSTSPIEDKSLVAATRIGFSRLFSYFQGKNNRKQKIKITAPVTSEVSVSGGKSSVVVSLYLPREIQRDPPAANGVYVGRFKTSSVAVRQFGGFVTASTVSQQVAALNASLAGTKWSATPPKSYIVAQYDPPFRLLDRVNEIWHAFADPNLARKVKGVGRCDLRWQPWKVVSERCFANARIGISTLHFNCSAMQTNSAINQTQPYSL
ncbi:unnamed protein product [Sphenostylis stenocarpa]|uniref:Heme-binding protein 2 n=1 Tax=Sphenostylis stenocarpa TaxID=92480 RepID=A0AA86SKM8_9FABA|nr:unnamed protein product [Sphenostylis stenocarpa]